MSTNLTIAYYKREAKKIKKDKGISHAQALDLVARSHGFSNWIHCIRSLSQPENAFVEKVPKPFEISFTDWLKRHSKRNSPLGDLSTDMLRDKTWPSYDSLDKYRSYLFTKNPHHDAVAALERAWKAYSAYVKRKNSPTSVKPKVKKAAAKNHDPRKITYITGAQPIHYTKRAVEQFAPGDKAWISWEGTKAIPVTIIGADDTDYTMRIERPIKKAGERIHLRLDEVRSTPELACMNYVTW